MSGEVTRLQASHFCPLLENGIDRLRIERSLRHRAQTSDPPEDAAFVDFGCSYPDVQRLDRTAGEINDVILFAACGFGAAEMDGKRG